MPGIQFASERSSWLAPSVQVHQDCGGPVREWPGGRECGGEHARARLRL